MSADEALFADNGAIENGRTHADQNFITDRAGMDYGGVTDGDVVADETGELVREVKNGIVLDVGMVADDDAVDVASNDGVIPDARVVAEGDVAEDDRAFGDINVLAKGGLFAKESFKLVQKFIHESDSE